MLEDGECPAGLGEASGVGKQVRAGSTAKLICFAGRSEINQPTSEVLSVRLVKCWSLLLALPGHCTIVLSAEANIRASSIAARAVPWSLGGGG